MKFLLVVIYQIAFISISLVLSKRIGAFGCFDDCFNFGAGHFMLQGKYLYSEIFFNHQPFMAYISAAVQYITHPQTLFELIKYHRILVLLFADMWGTVLILRFGFPLFVSMILFEATKFYIFGDRFLAEGMIVYPMIYLVILIWNKYVGKIIHPWEYMAAALCSWFIFWMREPFIPWALVALGMVFRPKACIVFVLLSVITIVSVNIPQYLFNVLTVNFQREVGVQLLSGTTVAHILFYPAYILFGGVGNIFQNILFFVSIIFVIGVGYDVIKKKRYSEIAVALFLLALANLRVVPIGTLYFDAFHMIPWYGMFVAITAVLIANLWEDRKTKNISLLLYGGLGCILFYSFFSPASFLKERVDTNSEFTMGYGNYFAKGQVIKLLAKPADTMFVEMWEDPIYFVSGVPSAYSYSWYTSVMPFFPRYQIARNEMFSQHPPTFYVGACREGDTDSFALQDVYKTMYVQLLFDGKPACIYITKDTYVNVSDNQIDAMSAYGYSVPK